MGYMRKQASDSKRIRRTIMREKLINIIFSVSLISTGIYAYEACNKAYSSPLYPEKIVKAGEEAVRLVRTSKLADSVPLWITVLDWQDKNLGVNDQRTIRTHKNLSAIYLSLGLLDLAEINYSKLRERLSLDEEENRLSILQVDIQRTFLLLMQDRYEDAERLGNDTLLKLELEQQSNSTQEQADLIDILASINTDQGRLKEARDKIMKVLSLRKRLDGPNSLSTASSLNNLAQNSIELGLIAESITLQNQVLRIYRHSKYPATPAMISTALSNLALSKKLIGQHSQGKKYMKEAIKMRIQASGIQHPVTARLFLNLGLYEEQDGNVQEALKLYQKSFKTMQNLSPPDILGSSDALQRMAELARNTKNTSKALEWGNAVLTIRQQKLSRNHPKIATSLFHLAMTELQQNNPRQAIEYLNRCLLIREKILGVNHPYTALTQLILGIINWEIDHRKGEIFLTNASLTYSRFIIDQAAKLTLKERLPLLNSYREAIDILYGFAIQGEIGKRIAFEARINLHGRLEEIERRQKYNLQQKAKSNNDEIIATLRDDQLVDVAMLSEVLQQNEALIEFIYYKPKILDSGILKQSDSEIVIAMILKSNGDISAVNLGPATSLNKAIWMALVKTQRADLEAQSAWNKVADLVLKPLRDHLKSINTWYFSLDGELHRIPFAALELYKVDSTSDNMSSPTIRIITTGRELLDKKVESANQSDTNLILADPDYLNTSTSIAIKSSELGESHYIPDKWRKLRWNRLPGARIEGEMISNTIGGKLFTDKEANIQSLLNKAPAKIIHIASHGAFLTKAKPPQMKSLNLALEGKVIDWDDPMSRSVVLLAGANNDNLSIQANGYVMAKEVSLLNLYGTDLVTISACQSGVGTIEMGDGIYGLRRALSIAGAKATMLSLWKVDDRGTAAVMKLFYKNLSNGYSPEKSLKLTQASLRKHKNLEFRNPYIWASFQLYGKSWGHDK